MAERLYTQKELTALVANEVAQVVAQAAVQSRRLLARSLGQHTAYEGQRDYYETLGYPPTIEFDDYLQRYERQDIATRVVDLPAVDTWKYPPAISEDGKDDTPFVKAWDALAQRLRVWSYLSRADRLSGIGRYGVLLLGVKGNGDLSDPVKQGSLGNEKSVLYLRPFSEGSAEIKTWEDDTGSDRYGLPLMYSVTLREDQTPVNVHWTRLLHLADNRLDSEVYGLPRLQRVFNRLDDMIKIVGGGSEAAWLNMRQYTAFVTQEGYKAPETSDERDDVRESIRKIAHDMLRVGYIEGLEPKTWGGAGEIPDPRALFDITVACISAASNIPQRVLLGSAAGELAAAKEDMRQWAGQIAARQSGYAEPDVLRSFIDHLIWLGALPKPGGGYDVGEMNEDGTWSWPPLTSLTELEEAEVMEKKAGAVATLANAVAPAIDGDEQRALLGYPPEEAGDEEPEAGPEDGEPEGVEMPEEGGEAEAGTPAGMVAQARENLLRGSITPEIALEYAAGTLHEMEDMVREVLDGSE